MDSMSEIVQFPAIRKDGVDLIWNVDLLHMSDEDLQRMARIVSGKVVYKKVRAVYTTPEQTLCVHYGCYSLGINGTDDCGRHSS